MTQMVGFAHGGAIPGIGLGTSQLTGRTCVDAVQSALRSGYRHIDTAFIYRNEAEIGSAWRGSGVPRDELFLTTKLPPKRAGRARETLEESMRGLGVEHVDLWLIHWPPDGGVSPQLWAEFVEARDAGLTRHIGVSNYSLAQIDELVRTSGEAPALDQIPFGPSDWDAKLVAALTERGVVVEGYSAFKRTDLHASALVTAAAAHGVSVAQVIVRWHVQHEVVVIPKSKTPERIVANIDVTGFALNDDEMAALDALGGPAHVGRDQPIRVGESHGGRQRS